MSPTTAEDCVTRVLELERRHLESMARHAMQRARYEAAQAGLQLATAMYVDGITAPLRALAWELRECANRSR